MKKVICVFAIVVAVLLSFLLIIILNPSEWAMHSETHYIDIAVASTNETISEIEQQVKKEVIKKFPNAYLGEIQWLTCSGEGFRTFSEGELRFIYCENLGSLNGYYEFDRYVRCEVIVDIRKMKITKIYIHGNNQTGGYATAITNYPEIFDIKRILEKYGEDAHSTGEVDYCYVSIIGDKARVSTKFSDNPKELIKGIISKRSSTSDEWLFAKVVSQGGD